MVVRRVRRSNWFGVRVFVVYVYSEFWDAILFGGRVFVGVIRDFDM